MPLSALPFRMSDETDPIRDALNRHGVFLKKAVLEALPVRDLKIHEEIGSTFGGTRVADIVTIEKFPDGRILNIVIECKRVTGTRWVFFRHSDPTYRLARQIGGSEHGSEMRRDPKCCCSEGFEWPIPRGKSDAVIADTDPVYKAACQLSAAYVGFAHNWRKRTASLPARGERFVPVLVTTAQLSIVQNAFDAASLTTGCLDDSLVLRDVEELVLKHPFPTPEGVDDDFRSRTVDPWQHKFTESLYVVRADSLSEFFNPERREGFAYS